MSLSESLKPESIKPRIETYKAQILYLANSGLKPESIKPRIETWNGLKEDEKRGVV